MNLLENDRVRKFFGVDLGGHNYPKDMMAYLVLMAMGEPIQMGEKYLYVCDGCQIRTWGEERSSPIEGWHPYHLRLPDAFQKQEKEKYCLQ